MDMERVGSASASRARDADVTHAKGPASAFVRSSTTADEIRSLSAVLRRFLGTGRRVRARSAQPAPRARGRDDAEPVRFAGAAEPAGRWRVAEAQSVRVERAAGVRRGRRANVRGSPPDATPMGPRRVRGHPRGASGGPVSPTVSSRTNSRRRRPPRACTRRPPRCTPRARPRDRRDTARRGANPITTPSAIAGGARATAPASAASRPSALRPRRRTPPPPQPPRCSSRRRNPPLVSPDPRAVRPPPAPTLFVPPRDAGAGAPPADGPLARVRAAHRRAVARRASTTERRASNLPSRPRALLQRRRVGSPRARWPRPPADATLENADVSRVRQRHARFPRAFGRNTPR